MRTIDPQNIKTDYLAALGDVRDTFNAANASGISATSKKLISEFSFLSASILLEGFISDLFVAYINRDNSVFVGYLLGKMSVDTGDSHAKRAKNFASHRRAGVQATRWRCRSLVLRRDCGQDGHRPMHNSRKVIYDNQT